MPFEPVTLDVIVQDAALFHLVSCHVKATVAESKEENRNRHELCPVEELCADLTIPKDPLDGMVADEGRTAGHLARLDSMFDQLEQFLFRLVLEGVLLSELFVVRVKEDVQFDFV